MNCSVNKRIALNYIDCEAPSGNLEKVLLKIRIDKTGVLLKDTNSKYNNKQAR